jgi:D-glycero-D-manno-heptose 1,7-bisphosphate phosphatase
LVLTGKGQKTVAKGNLPEGTQIHADLMAFTTALLKAKA